MLAKLKSKKNWVTWKREDRNGKVTKVPYDARTGKKASCNDTNTWCSYEKAMSAVKKYGYDGIGFELGGSQCVAIDIDHCFKGGKLTPFAQNIVNECNTYTEISPSGEGIRMIFIYSGSLKLDKNKDSSVGLEIYNDKRYVTITENIWEKAKPIRTLNPFTAAKFLNSLFPKKEEKKKGSPQTVGSVDPTTLNDKSDDEVLDKMFNSKNVDKIRSLYNGNISEHDDDHSAADLALVNHLIYWCNGDAKQVDRLFRESELYREKWDEKHSSDGRTYGQMTIDTALTNFNSYVSPVALEKPTSNDFSNPRYFIESGKFEEHSLFFRRFSKRGTGFSNMDRANKLYPGLYVLGAISSIGKTTFVLQMATQIAATGNNVLYFTYEQSKYELISKGLAYEGATCSVANGQDLKHNPSALDIRKMKSLDDIRCIKESYLKKTESLYIIQCDFDTSVENIEEICYSFMDSHPDDMPPVVFIDYLQVIGGNTSDSTKTHMDKIVKKLKQMTKDPAHAITVILISSFNRSNYLTPVSFESFKESGDIEYTADVVWGLQLDVMNDDIFTQREKITEKRKKVSEAKSADPRKLELVVLKNRYGATGKSFYFDYYPKYDYYAVLDKEIKPFNRVLKENE